jgi:Uma2 family endonuclease
MPRSEPVQKATFADYLALEKQSSPHELVGGQMYPLPENNDNHDTITLNIATLARAEAKGTACRVFMGNMKLRVSEDTIYYPDVFATCTEPNSGATLKRSACFVVEVLSDATSDIDRGEKLRNYRKVPSLQGYIMVVADKRIIEVYSRLEGSAWRYETLEDGGVLNLPGLDLSLTMDEIYEDVTLG